MKNLFIWALLGLGGVILPAQVPSPKVATPKIDWFALAVVSVDAGATAADVWLTHDCLQAKTCYEANPLMPSSLTGQITINLGLFASEVSAASKLRKQGSKIWWMPLITGASTHLAGVGVTLSQ